MQIFIQIILIYILTVIITKRYMWKNAVYYISSLKNPKHIDTLKTEEGFKYHVKVISLLPLINILMVFALSRYKSQIIKYQKLEKEIDDIKKDLTEAERKKLEEEFKDFKFKDDK